jgi:hypothetical protein
MNPINAINQEFARMIVAEWNEEASIRRQQHEAIEAPLGIGVALQALVAWMREWMRERIARQQPAENAKFSQDSAKH